jgi:hypothetical protein
MLRTSPRAALVLLALASPALALESEAEPAIGLSNNLGLCGFQDMVDARVPGFLSLRASLRYDVGVRQQEVRDEGGRVVREREEHGVTAVVGASAFGALDAAIRIPYVYRRDDTDVRGAADRSRARYDEGWSDIEVAGKLSYTFGGLLTMGSYAWGRLPESGEPDVGDIASFEFGSAATFSLLNEFLALHANLSGLQLEPGAFAFRYRVGVSFVFVTTEILTIRAYGYLDGLEHEGKANSDVDVDMGVQVILWKMFTAEVGTSVRLVDSGRIDDSLRKDLAAERIADRHFDDEGTWGLSLVGGVLLTF